MKDTIGRIAVVGAGSWGTALANLLGENGYDVDLWVYEAEVKEQIAKQRENLTFLPGFRLSDNLTPSNDLAAVVEGKQLVLMVTPSHLTRSVLGKISGVLSPDATLVSASKGIENETFLTMSGVYREVLSGVTDDRYVVLSGPSFAKEVARRVPTLVTAASKNAERAEMVQKVFSSPYFRVYTSDDVVGVELGGAVKNVIAIASGMIDGLGLGLNTRAAIITRGLAEMRRLGVKLEADPRTFSGLSGVGDLILTCTGDLSRNHTVGMKLGQGMSLDAILSEMKMVAEGVKTAKSVYNLSRKKDVEMPICHAIYKILYEGLSPQAASRELMARDLRKEFNGGWGKK
jgi:glycerol-3-phosphate dehydrogenase (NAD(P)+)